MYHGIVFRYLYPFINMPSLLICFNLYIHDQYNGFKLGERPRIATQSYNNYIPISWRYRINPRGLVVKTI